MYLCITIQNEKFRRGWAQTKSTSFHFNRIERFALVESGKEFHQLTRQTLYDIDFEELFMLIDRTNSRVGQQYLYKKLTHPTNDLDALKN